jgi:amidophosphoribosyltransferase
MEIKGENGNNKKENHFVREIHILKMIFRNKFEDSMASFSGKSGIGVISDTDAQPIMMICHLGKFAIVTVARINNLVELKKSF